MYQALYRKYRPRTFDDMVGQEHITRTLKNEVAAGKPSHAYLFCGTRGTGKTSCSKILAKALNCPNQTDGNPCLECDLCRGIDNDSVLDVTEIDAASNSGVDNIRELREEANFTPAAAKYRVYIIDETHMLSQGAFNALLKIMEEPPPHVVFVLATTEIHKVPATILSRCQRFDFRRIPSADIAGRLLQIAGEESFSLQEDAAMLIARLSDGGLRDALSLLDLCASRGDEVTVETVRACGGLVGQEHLFQIGQALADKDAGKAMSILEDLWAQSVDCQRLCEQLITYYRNLMVAKTVREPGELIACLPGEMEQYKQQADSLDISRILYCLEVLQDTMARMSRTSMRRSELEMGLLKLANPDLDLSPTALLSRVQQLESALRAGGTAPVQRASQGPVEQRAPARPPAKGKAEAQAPPPQPAASVGDAEIDKTQVELFMDWNKVLGVLKKKNPALYGALADSAAYVGGGLLLVDTGEGSVFANMMRGDSYAKESLRVAALEVTGQKFRLGPYNPERYTMKKQLPDKLSELLKSASELGIDVQVK